MRACVRWDLPVITNDATIVRAFVTQFARLWAKFDGNVTAPVGTGGGMRE